MEENICSSTIPCALYFINFGLRNNLGDMNLISYKNEIEYYLRQFFLMYFIYFYSFNL